MLADRREELTRSRVQTVNRLQRLLSELLPGQAKRDITTAQAKALLATVRPRDIAGKTRRRIAAEELAELVAIEAKMKKSTAELKALVTARRSRLMDLHGVGPVVAARTLADVGDVDPVRRSEPVRVLDRHRTPGRVLRRADPAPTVAGREPADEPHDPHRRDQPDPPRHPRPRLLPTQARHRGRHPSKRCAASSAGSPTPSTASSSPTPKPLKVRTREGTAGRLKNPARSTRTRHIDTSDQPLPDPRHRRYARPRRPGRGNSDHPLDTEGSRNDSPSCDVRTALRCSRETTEGR